MKDTDIAWAAGFFDGEGSIIFPNNRGVRLNVCQKVPAPLERFIKIFKLGNILINNTKYKSQPYSYYSVNIYGETARSILRLMLPYLTVKKVSALQALNQKRIYSRDDKRIRLICLLHSKGHSFTTIGKMLGISRQRAHQIHSQNPQPLPLNSQQLTYLNYFYEV